MKTYVLFLALHLLVITASAKIKNGYIDIEGARVSLSRILSILNQERSLTANQKISISKKRNELINYIIYHGFTEKQLDQFNKISPDLYNDLDKLKDGEGWNPDVFVKFVPEEEMPPSVAGATFVSQDESDEDAYHSEYGPGTVSVRIAIGNNGLKVLAHELGHVKYQVLNSAQYFKFYSANYCTSAYQRNSIGHDDHDESGKSAGVYTRRFKKSYSTFLKQGQTKPKSHLTLLQEIKKEVTISPEKKVRPDHQIQLTRAEQKDGTVAALICDF